VRITDPHADHFLRAAGATRVPHSCVFVTCQSKSELPIGGIGEIRTFATGAAVHARLEGGEWTRRNSITFTDNFDFWEWLAGRQTARDPVWIFANNLKENAAFLGVWDRVDDGILKLNVPCKKCGEYESDGCKGHKPFRGACVVSDPPVILVFATAKGVIKILDITNYLDTPLEKIGLSVGHPRIAVSSDEPGPEVLAQVVDADLTIIEKTMSGIIATWDREQCGAWATTAAGLSWAAFRQTVDYKQILIDHEEKHTAAERAGYYGGQAESFFIGRCVEPIHYLDVRSMYPSVMHSHRYPVHFLHEGHQRDPTHVLRRLAFDCAIARVTVRTERAGYPKRIVAEPRAVDRSSPVRRRVGAAWQADRLGFPVGEYSTTLAGPELRRAIERDELLEIQSIYWYRSAKIFTNFVESWFHKRPQVVDQQNYTDDLLYKTVLNSLSGKFGQHKQRWKDRPGIRAQARWGEWPSVRAETEEVTRMRAIGGYVQELEAGGESKDSFPGISAYITSYGREQMLWLREQCPERSVVYQNTDSLLVTDEGYYVLNQKGLIGTTELGRLRFVETLHNLEIFSLNDYQHDGGKVLSGVKAGAESVGGGQYRTNRVESIAAQWSRTPDGSVLVEPVLISLARDSISRTRNIDGWTTPPRFRAGDEVPF
jgi:hypothetical protein